MIITVDMLKSLGACDVRPFVRCFGNSAEVTRENLMGALDSWLPIDWLGNKLFGDGYADAMAIHRSAFVKAMEDSGATLRESAEWRESQAIKATAWNALLAETAQSKPGAWARYGEAMQREGELQSTMAYLQWRQSNSDALRSLDLARVAVFLKLADEADAA